jgi:DNA (cytosine-5)-methyltransferase 1
MKRDAFTRTITFGSVCSGIEAFSVAVAGRTWEAAWLAEIEPFPCKVLHHHYGSGRPVNMPSPDEDGLSDEDRDARRANIKSVASLPTVLAAGAPPNYGDFTRIAALVRSRQAAAPDVLVGGTPCQAFSIAGLRNSLGDARGQLTLSFVDLADAIDATRAVDGKPAAIIVWENVPGVLSTKDNAFGCFLGALAGEDCELVAPGGKWPNAGCVFGPKRAIAWRVTDAQYFGVAQRRRRVFVVASAMEGFDPTEVLFEFDGLRRDIAPSREAGQDVAGTISSRTTGGGGLGTDFELGGGYSHVAGTLRSTDGGSDVDHALAAQLQPVGINDGVDLRNGTITGQVAHTLQAGHHAPDPGGTPHVLSVALRGRDGGATAELGDEVAGCLRASGGGGDKAHILAPIAFSMKDYGGDATLDLAPTLRAGNHNTSHANGGQPPAIAFDARQDCTSSTEVFGALGSSSPQAQAVCVTPIDMRQASRGATMTNNRKDGSSGGAPGTGIGNPGDPSPTMSTSHVPAICITGDITHTLKAEGFDASEDGTGRGQPIVAAFAENSRAEIRLEGGDGSRTGALSTGGDKPGQGTPMVQVGMAVRRLLPVECERLQAFPDFYTLITLSIVTASRAETMLAKGDSVQCIDGVWWKLSADGPRYKALGNSMCVRNMRWIAVRIETAILANFAHEREIARLA